MFSWCVLPLFVAAGVTHVWVESPVRPVETAASRPPSAQETGRIYAARGERESFQLWVRAGRRGLEGLEIEVEGIDGVIPAPRVLQFGIIEESGGAGRAIADPLLPPVPRNLERGETSGYWLTYAIPRDARPGVHNTRINIRSEDGRRRSVPVRVEIFDFELPETPSLRSLFPLDRRVIERAYGLDPQDLEQWRPVYDALAESRISFSVWDGGGLVQPRARQGLIAGSGGDPARPDLEAFKDHLEYAVRQCGMSAIDIGGFGSLMRVFPARPGTPPPDPLQLALHDLMLLIQVLGWEDRVLAKPLPAGILGSDEAEALRHMGELHPGVPRLVAGTPRPGFEGAAELWALPFEDKEEALTERLRAGEGIQQLRQPRAEIVATASAPGANPRAAFDGSVFSVWRSGFTPNRNRPARLDFQFEAPVDIKEIVIYWAPEADSADIAVFTAFPGGALNTSTTRWDHELIPGPRDRVRSTGVLRYEKRSEALRLEFRNSVHGGAIGVAEIVIAGAAEPAETLAHPVEPWLLLVGDAFPGLGAARPPAEARFVPWACWSAGSAGFLAPNLNAWPAAWRPGGEDGRYRIRALDDAPLVYPGSEGLLPSLRLEALRDGLEDYEYLAALAALAREGEINDPELRAALARGTMGPQPAAESLEPVLDRIQEVRVKIGREITRRQRSR